MFHIITSNALPPDEDLCGQNVVLLQLLHMFATWMLSITTGYMSEAVAMSLYDIATLDQMSTHLKGSITVSNSGRLVPRPINKPTI